MASPEGKFEEKGGKSEVGVIKTAKKFGPTVKVRRSYEVEKEQSKVLSRPHSTQGHFKIQQAPEQSKSLNRPHSSFELYKSHKDSSINDELGERQQLTWQTPKSVSLWNNGKLNTEVLKPLLLHPDIADLPVAVLAVAGEYRTGKSFLLSYILRLLRYLDIRTDKNKVNSTFICDDAKIKAYTKYQETMVDYVKSSESCWSDEELQNMSDRTMNYVVSQYDKVIASNIPDEVTDIAKEKKEELKKECLANYQKYYSLNFNRKTKEEPVLKEEKIAEAEKISGDWLGDPDEPLQGFVHKHSLEPVTIGIDVWNEPFIVEKDGEKVAIILMDTQGIFDNEHSLEESYFIFAFSIMVSSLFVYNIHKEVNDHHHLEHLKMFIDYAKECKTDNSQNNFQKLMFLIRDWSNVSEFSFGIEGGNHRIQEYLKIRNCHGGQVADIRKYIRDTWEDIQCYLMPHPGYDVTESNDYDGNLAGLRPAFKTHLKKLIEELMSPDKLIMKNISGIPITAAHLYLHIQTSAKNFEEKAASPQNFREVNSTFICDDAKIKAYTKYQETMVDYVKSSESCWSDEELQNMSDITMNYAVSQYDKVIASNVPDELTDIANGKKEELKKECLANYQKCYLLNFNRKTKEEPDLKEKKIAEAEKEAKAPWYQTIIGESVGGIIGGTVGMVLGTIVSPGLGTAAGAVAGVEAGKALGSVIGGYAGAGMRAVRNVKQKIKD